MDTQDIKTISDNTWKISDNKSIKERRGAQFLHTIEIRLILM